MLRQQMEDIYRTTEQGRLDTLTPEQRRIWEQGKFEDYRKEVSDWTARKFWLSLLAGAAAVVVAGVPGGAQQSTGVPGSPGATTTIDGRNMAESAAQAS
jgi:hypothetical protein